MSASLRNRGGDNVKQDGDDDGKPDHPRPKADRMGAGGRIYILCIALLSSLLFVTLYLLRHDNMQLGIAERRIKDLRRHVRRLMNRS